MSAYFVLNYTITDPDGYAQYSAAALPTLATHSAEIVVADYDSGAKEGNPGAATVVVRFESKEAALAWYESDDYQAAKALRMACTDGIGVLCNGFEMPS